MDKEYLIKKWLNNELTEAEKDVFKELDDYELNTNILDAAKYFKASNFSINRNFEAFKERYESNKNPVRRLSWLKPVIQIAAALVIGFGIYFYAFKDTITTFQTLSHQKSIIELPDQSKVRLNALSQIKFNKNDWQHDRHVKLNGEAYFMVEKGSKFDVVTSDGLVSVLGTKFNVKQRHNYFEVKCFEGVVSVISNKIKRILYVGDTFRILNGSFIEDKTGFVEPQWINNVSRFNEVPFLVVIEEFERQYDVKVALKSVNSMRKFTGGFKHDNIKQALISITKPMGLTYEVSSSNDIVIHENTN
ncbi:FecR family protein [uncultured Algibacter sp.]|uniref:FecR family protein n=1 Tax=uncultured Algibacter sp. TaxID=298659 RepID=UPI002602847E|nr:FecR family protein [uncultured Algibacter sp.]